MRLTDDQIVALVERLAFRPQYREDDEKKDTSSDYTKDNGLLNSVLTELFGVVYDDLDEDTLKRFQPKIMMCEVCETWLPISEFSFGESDTCIKCNIEND